MFAARLVTDSAGVTPATYAYSAFGSTRASTGSIANEVRFTGERTDTESGLEFLRARTYDPSTGTFLQRDTWGITPTDSQSIDAYVYTANNPTNAVDPSGHISVMYDGGRDVSAPSTVHSGGGSWDTPPKAVDKAASQPQGRPDCGWNPACAINNAIGTAGDLGRDLGGGVGNAYSQTIGNNFMNPAADTLGSWGIKYDATVGFCVGGDISYGLPIGWGAQGVGSFCAYAGTNGQLAYGVTYGGGLGPSTKGGHAGLDIGPLFTNASGDPYDQEGPFVNSNGEASDGPAGFFVSGTGGTKRCGGLMYNVSGGWAPGLGASESSGGTVTKTDIWWSSHDAPPPC